MDEGLGKLDLDVGGDPDMIGRQQHLGVCVGNRDHLTVDEAPFGIILDHSKVLDSRDGRGAAFATITIVVERGAHGWRR
nr:hypothetical protein [uncultured Brevundimonas sp.]